MITRSTVFILGAGASTPYGYPSGRGLVQEIIKTLSDQRALYQLCISLEYDPKEIKDFLITLRNADPPSIDSFLETKRKSEELGKTLIGLALFMKENPDTLTTYKGDEGEKWYGDLVNKLKTPFVNDFSKNKVSFLTFNYDRSFDHYLFTSIKHSYDDLSDEKCAEIVRTIPIIHLHGQIGTLPWQNEHSEGRPYQSKRNEIDLLIKNSKLIGEKKIDGLPLTEARYFVNKQISGQIKIIHENELDNDPAFKDAHRLLKDAERVYFLGFGYNDENLRRLKIADLSENITKEVAPGSTATVRRTIEGTAHEIGEVRRDQIYSANKIHLYEHYKVKDFIRERVDFS